MAVELSDYRKARIVMASDSDILFRLERLGVAVRVARNRNVSQIRPRVVETDKFRVITQDFRGGASDAELCNWLHEVIERTVSLRDHLEEWARLNGKDASKVSRVFESHHLNILRRVWNSDKHKKRKEHLANFDRNCQLRSKNGQAASIVGDKVSGDVSIVTTADVLDPNGNRLGDVHDFLEPAIADIETLVRELGFTVGN